jgi:hypothetical protein
MDPRNVRNVAFSKVVETIWKIETLLAAPKNPISFLGFFLGFFLTTLQALYKIHIVLNRGVA